MAELNARIIAKASATAAEEPLAADLEVAELAVNTADGKLFTKHTDGSVVTISGGGGSGVSVPSVIGTYIDSESDAATSVVLSAPAYSQGNLLVAVIMSRNSGGTVTPPSGFVLHGTYLSSMAFAGDGQVLTVFTKTATASEPTSYTWTLATSARICGWIASVSSNTSIETVLEGYGNAETATINTVSDRLNLTAATWVYSVTSGTETYSQSGDGLVEITDSPKELARISGGYTTVQTTVTSSHQSTTVDNSPNHGIINIVLKSVESINSNDDVDTSSTPPTDSQVLTWVDANSQWEPADAANSVAGKTGAVTLELNDSTDVGPATAAATMPANTVLAVTGQGVNGATTFPNLGTPDSGDGTAGGDAQISNAQSKFYGTSIALDGVSDAVVIPHDDEYNLGGNDFTVQFWVRFNVLTNGLSYAFCDKSSANTTNVGWRFYYSHSTTGNSSFWYTRTSNGFSLANEQFVYSSNRLDVDTWYHIRLCQSGGLVRCFLNGVLVGSTQNTGVFEYASTADLRIGARFTTNSNGINGYINDFQVINGTALNTSDTTFTPPTAGIGSPVEIAPTDGQVLTWVDANSQWEPVDTAAGDIDSVNGETGVVSLGIQDMEDYYRPTVYYWATRVGGSPATGEFKTNGFAGRELLTTGGTDSNSNSPITDGWTSLTAGAPVWWKSDTQTSWQQTTLYSNVQPSPLAFTIVEPPEFDAGGIGVGELYLTFEDPEPTNGDFLQWSSADQKFKPAQLPAVINKTTLQTELAASTDFADFQSRIAAL